MIPKVPKHTSEDFIVEEMNMSHIYQPAMLKVLLENGGEASVGAPPLIYIRPHTIFG